jgi:subtilisin family serine protease
MKTETYVILTDKSPIVPTMDNLGTRGGPAARDIPELLAVEEADLTVRERSNLRRDPRVRAIAPPMPMALVRPVESAAVQAAEAAEMAWGVAAVGAADSPFDGSGITVAVLDTGIDPLHPAFAGVELVRRNFTAEGDDDTVGHGTHCAGTVFGQDLDGRRIGVARNVRRALIGKVLGEGGGSSATIAMAIQWAVDQGAHVVSMSLGIDFPGFVEMLVQRYRLDINPATSMALEAYRANVNLFTELASYVRTRSAFGQGCVIVAASGNESQRPEYEIAVGPPAAGTGIISVGALEKTAAGLSVARFSNNQVDVSAPGVEIVSAVPGGGLGVKSGTSMATPHVAGVAALWAQQQLETTGGVDGHRLAVKLIGSGTTESLVTGSEAEDYGNGLVRAPMR